MSSYEEKIVKILKKEKIKFVREKSFPDLKKGKYRFDFFIPDYDGAPVVCEVNGIQHYEQVKKFQPTRQDFLAQKERDRRKISYCLAHGIALYIIPYWDIDKIQKATDIFQKKYLATSRWKNDLDKKIK